MAADDKTKVELLVMYKDCMHNHAAPGKGFHLDGCGLFASRSESGSLDDMLCAACNCHRNFHRRVAVDIPRYLSSHSDRRQHQGSGAMIIHEEPASAPPPQAPTSPSASCTTVDQAPHEAPAQQGASVVRRKRMTRQ